MSPTEGAPLSFKDRIGTKLRSSKEYVRSKVVPVVRSAEQVVWENIGKPLTRKQFEKEGFADPEKALAVVEYLSQNTTTVVWRSRRPADHPYDTQHYRYHREDVEIIRQLSEEIDNPVELLEKLGKYIDFHFLGYSSNVNLDKLGNYISSIKDQKRLLDIFTRLDKIGPLLKLSIGDIRFGEGDGEAKTYFSEYYLGTVADPFRVLLEMSEEEYAHFASDESLERLRQFNERIRSRARHGEDQNEPLINVAHIPTLLRVNRDSITMNMFMGAMRSGYYSGFDVARSLPRNIHNFEETLREAPELIDLYLDGFPVYDYLEYNGYSYEGDREFGKRIGLVRRDKPIFQAIVGDEVLRKNARLLKQHGLVMPLRPQGRDEEDFVRTQDTANLEKALVIWSKAGESLGLYGEHARGYDYKNTWNFGFFVWNNIPHDLSNLSVEEIQEMFSVFDNPSYKENPLSVPIRVLVGDAKSAEKMKARIEAVCRPEMRTIAGDSQFTTLIGQDGIWGMIAETPEKIDELYKRREELYRKVQLLQNRRGWLNLRHDLDTCLAVLQEPDEALARIGEKCAEVSLQIDSHNLEKFRLVSSLSPETQQGIIDELKRHNVELRSLFDPDLSCDAVSVLSHLTVDERNNLYTYIDFLGADLGYTMNRRYGDCNYSEVIVFANRVLTDPSVRSRFDAYIDHLSGVGDQGRDVYMYKRKMSIATSNFARLIIGSSQDSRFNVDDYVSENGVATVRFVEFMSNDVSQVPDVITDEVLNAMDPERKIFWSYFKNIDHAQIQQFLINRLKNKGEDGSTHFDYSGFSDLVIDGTPTLLFIETYSEQNLDTVYNLLTPEALERMESSSRLFWTYFKSIDDTRVQRFLITRVKKQQENGTNYIDYESFNEWIKGNIPTLRFIEELSDQHLQIVGQYLTPEALERMEPESRDFWNYFKTVDDEEKENYTVSSTGKVQQFLVNKLKKRREGGDHSLYRDYGVFNELVRNGVPTLKFIEEFSEGNLEAVPILLKPEVLEQMDPGSKTFWTYFRSIDVPQVHQLLVKRLRKQRQDGTTHNDYANIPSWLVSRESDREGEKIIGIDSRLPNLFKKDKDGNYTNVTLMDLVFQNEEILLGSLDDVKFINRVVGLYGGNAKLIIEGYIECLKQGVIVRDERGLIEELLKEFRSVSVPLVSEFKKAKEQGMEGLFLAELRDLADKMICTGESRITQKDRDKPYYIDVLHHVYQNNSGHWTDWDRNNSCEDKSFHLSGLVIRDKYIVDIFGAADIRCKEGQEIDEDILEGLQKPIYDVSSVYSEVSYDPTKMRSIFEEELKKHIDKIQHDGNLGEFRIEDLKSTEEKLFALLVEARLGGENSAVDLEVVKKMIIMYEFATFEDIREYINGTNDRVAYAQNRNYALLSELSSFYQDRIKEIYRRILEHSYTSDYVKSVIPLYFKKLQAERQRQAIKLAQAKVGDVSRYGLSEGFLRQIKKYLKGVYGKDYSLEQVGAIVEEFESSTRGLLKGPEYFDDARMVGLYGQVGKQREKTFATYQTLSGKPLEEGMQRTGSEIYLGDISFEDLLASELSLELKGEYNEDQFASYLGANIFLIFNREVEQISGELDKYETDVSTERKLLYGYITKNKEAAHARMVGGVCVSGDNPDKNQERNIWNMENYLQLVLQDPEDFRCQGLVLLHRFEEDGKKVLTASFNPSSTYILGVDQHGLFKALLQTLGDFARDNGFDMVAVSQNKQIRTNRTGGAFESAIDTRIQEVGETYSFPDERQFSYSPEYRLKDMDVIWRK
jgi:hypothetical protein